MDGQSNVDVVSVKLEVYYEGQEWIGICEKSVNSEVSICRIEFGPEMDEPGAADYLNRNWYRLEFIPEFELKQAKDMAQKAFEDGPQLVKQAIV